MNNFDQDVIERVRIQSHDVLDRFNERLWLLARHALRDHATFSDTDHSFVLNANPFPDEIVHAGPYRMGRQSDDVNTFRVGHPLAQRIIEEARATALTNAELRFDYSHSGKKMAAIEPLRVGRHRHEAARFQEGGADSP